MKLVEFTKKFATKSKGDKLECSSSLASVLVNKDKVAKYVKESKKK
jgi:hypothetical protein